MVPCRFSLKPMLDEIPLTSFPEVWYIGIVMKSMTIIPDIYIYNKKHDYYPNYPIYISYYIILYYIILYYSI